MKSAKNIVKKSFFLKVCVLQLDHVCFAHLALHCCLASWVLQSFILQSLFYRASLLNRLCVKCCFVKFVLQTQIALLCLQLLCSHNLKVEVGDVSACVRGDTSEQHRDVYLRPTADPRTRLGIDKGVTLKCAGSAYGLRNAPRAWYRRVRKDLEALGRIAHQLDQCFLIL